MSVFKRQIWNPYAVGALIGFLSMIAFYTADQPLGVSTTFSRTAGMIEKVVSPESAVRNPYYQAKKLAVDWQWMLVLGIAIGAFISSRLSGSWKFAAIPPLWASRFGESAAKRLVAAFCGGALLLFGARLAGGCTSGHGISGSLQLALGSWVFFFVIFITGIITARILYGKRG